MALPPSLCTYLAFFFYLGIYLSCSLIFCSRSSSSFCLSSSSANCISSTLFILACVSFYSSLSCSSRCFFIFRLKENSINAHVIQNQKIMGLAMLRKKLPFNKCLLNVETCEGVSTTNTMAIIAIMRTL